MPKMDGIQATRYMKKKFPDIQIMMLTTFQDKSNIEMAINAGAEGYLLKTDKISDIAWKLRMLYKGTAVLDSGILKTLTAPPAIATEKLTKREQDVFELATKGLTNKEIATSLFLSEGTVRNVLSVVMEKLHVKNRTQLSLLGAGKSID